MKRTLYPGMLLVVCFTALTLPGCGGDDEETACDRAHAKFCACPTVTCTGKPSSCTGPDLEWANCINSASDPCTVDCLP